MKLGPDTSSNAVSYSSYRLETRLKNVRRKAASVYRIQCYFRRRIEFGLNTPVTLLKSKNPWTSVRMPPIIVFI